MDQLLTAIMEGIPDWVRAYGLWIGIILGAPLALMSALPELAKMRQTRRGTRETLVHWLDCLAGAVWALAVWLSLGIFVSYAIGSLVVGFWPYSLIGVAVVIGLGIAIEYLLRKDPLSWR